MAFESGKFAPSECNISTSGKEESGDTANTGAPRVYLYNTVDTIAVVEGANYFDDVVNAHGYDLNIGDIIITHFDTDGTPGVSFNYVDNVTGSRPNAVVVLSSGATLS